MQFSLDEWRLVYNQAHSLGKTLRNSKFTHSEYGRLIHPTIVLTEAEQKALENEIDSLLKAANLYLDNCHMK